MTNKPNSAPEGSKARFQFSLLVLVLLLLAKLWGPGGHTKAPPDDSVAQTDQLDPEFKPVAEENANVWGLAGSLLNLFSGGGSPSQIQRDADNDRTRRQHADQENNKRYWDDYDKRRAEEHQEKEQEMYDTQQRRQAEEQQYHDQQQQQYYEDKRNQEQNQ